MDIEREIQDTGIRREAAELSVRGEHEHLAAHYPDGILIFIRRTGLQIMAHRLQPVGQLPFPLYPLVRPVGRHTVLGDAVHPLGPDLNLHTGSGSVTYSDMEGFVSVLLGICYPISQTVGIGSVFFCNYRIGLPAHLLLLLRGTVDYYADGQYVVNLLESDALLLHLPEDGICRLGAALQPGIYPCTLKFLLQGFYESTCELHPVRFGGPEHIGDLPVFLGLRTLEIDIFQLALYLIKPQLMGKRHIEEYGLRNLPLV